MQALQTFALSFLEEQKNTCIDAPIYATLVTEKSEQDYPSATSRPKEPVNSDMFSRSIFF